MKAIIVVVPLTLFLMSCATKYVPPTSGPQAELIVPGSETSFKLLGGWTSNSVLFAVDNGNGCGKFNKRIKAPNGESNTQVTIPANKTIFLRASFGSGSSSCTPSGRFQPAEGGRYFVVAKRQQRTCSLSVLSEARDKTLSTVKLQRATVDKMTGLKVCSI